RGTGAEVLRRAPRRQPSPGPSKQLPHEESRTGSIQKTDNSCLPTGRGADRRTPLHLVAQATLLLLHRPDPPPPDGASRQRFANCAQKKKGAGAVATPAPTVEPPALACYGLSSPSRCLGPAIRQP